MRRVRRSIGGDSVLMVVGPSIIQFHTYFEKPLLNHVKQSTMRKNDKAWTRTHNTTYENQLLARAWCGGRGVVLGHVLYDSFGDIDVSSLTDSDIQLEGFGREGGVKVENYPLLAKTLGDCKLPLAPHEFISFNLRPTPAPRA